MKINHKTVNSALYISLSGELDENAAAYAREFLEALFERSAAKKVVMDLSSLTFMDSTGIGVLIGRFKKLKGRGIPVMIANPSKTADKILTLSGLYELMPKIIY
ncbi:MAG: anti-sigma factor antagonist [Clostridiales bacterium]|jgi:stage II sporulation protein AA (anti-sigma F factor antagonist)|nr:anti-sigma factor antagonist [Clostridiales bacterium]